MFDRPVDRPNLPAVLAWVGERKLQFLVHRVVRPRSEIRVVLVKRE